MCTSFEEYALLMEAGFLYRYARRFQEAREIFQSVRAVEPHNAMVEIALGGVSFDEGHLDDAVTHCLKAIALNPKNALAYTQLAEAQLLKRDMSRARFSLQRALELDSTGTSATVARALLKLADTFEAKKARP
jgi:Flp pilus assembly protein TadD